LILIIKWPYNEISSALPNFKAQTNNEFLVNIKKGTKKDNLRFSSDYRADILTEILRYSNLFNEKSHNDKVIKEEHNF
jgi:DnaJ homolog subfamily C member 13